MESGIAFFCIGTDVYKRQHYSKKDGSTQYSYRCGGYASRVNGCTAHSISADNVCLLYTSAVYQDDGYTGLNMERPDLKRMLKAIERRQINLVITKDLSRLGRNYLQTGTLIEDFFPRHGVRYIAMNDGIDTMRDNNDLAPFKNILNEMYSKDISKKVHSSYLLKAQQGQFTGCVAPFGYRKDPEDKNHLLVDEETAPIVRQIFLWALEGHGPNFIRRRLEEQKVPCPTWWNRERGFRNVRTKWEKKDPENGRYMWDFSVIKDILMNPVYTGAIASQKKDYRFKIGTIGEKKPQDWIVVEERHEPVSYTHLKIPSAGQISNVIINIFSY